MKVVICKTPKGNTLEYDNTTDTLMIKGSKCGYMFNAWPTPENKHVMYNILPTNEVENAFSLGLESGKKLKSEVDAYKAMRKKEMERKSKAARDYDNLYNEGGEGYNPYID